MGNPEFKSADIGALREKLKDSAETKPRTNLQKDYKRIESLMHALENPAPGMDKKLQQDKEQIYAQFDLPKNASLETIKIAFGHAVEAEKTMNSNETAREAFLQAGIESPYRIVRVMLEYNVLADEVGDLKESGLAKIDMSQEAKDKIKKFESINKEWQNIVNAMKEYGVYQPEQGSKRKESRTARVAVEKRYQGEKNPAPMNPQK